MTDRSSKSIIAAGVTGGAGRSGPVRCGRGRRGTRVLAPGWRALALGAFLAVPGHVVAQTARLSVRPQEIKRGKPGGQTGDILLDSLPGYALYVPQACTGEHRCPLVVVAADFPAYVQVMPQSTLGWQRPMADKYGLIMLVLDSHLPNRRNSTSFRQDPRKEFGIDARQLNAALTYALQQFAVDPDRLALLGYVSFASAGMPQLVRDVWPVAVQNLDVFSRVILSEAVTQDLPLPPAQAPSAQFLLAAEVYRNPSIVFRLAEALRRQGYPAELLLSLKSDGRGVWEELDYIGQWLQESWAKPSRGARASTQAAIAGAAGATDSLPLLTTAAIRRLAQFWASFQEEPDSIWRLGRRAHLREVPLPFGMTRLTDIAALAAQYPSVAAKLTAAELTPAEHDAYRLAFISAHIVQVLDDSAATLIAPNSVLAKNAAFLAMAQHDTALYKVLTSEVLTRPRSNWLPSGMWQTP